MTLQQHPEYIELLNKTFPGGDRAITNVRLGTRARGGSIDAQLDRFKSEEARIMKLVDAHNREDLKSRKAEARAQEPMIKIIVAAYFVKDPAKFPKTATRNMLDGLMKWQPEKFLKIIASFLKEQA